MKFLKYFTSRYWNERYKQEFLAAIESGNRPCKRCGYFEGPHEPVWDVVQHPAVDCEGFVPLDNLSLIEMVAKQKNLI